MDRFKSQRKGWILMLSYVIAVQVINGENKQEKEFFVTNSKDKIHW